MKYILATLVMIFSTMSFAQDVPLTIDCKLQGQHKPFAGAPLINTFNCLGDYPTRLPYVDGNGNRVVLATKQVAQCGTDGFCTLFQHNVHLGQVPTSDRISIYNLPKLYLLGTKADGSVFAYDRDLEGELKAIQASFKTTGQVAGVQMQEHTGEKYTLGGVTQTFDWEWATTSDNPAYNGPGTYLVECDETTDCWLNGSGESIKVSWMDLVKYVPVVEKTGNCDEYLCYDGGFVVGLNPDTYGQFAVK